MIGGEHPIYVNSRLLIGLDLIPLDLILLSREAFLDFCYYFLFRQIFVYVLDCTACIVLCMGFWWLCSLQRVLVSNHFLCLHCLFLFEFKKYWPSTGYSAVLYNHSFECFLEPSPDCDRVAVDRSNFSGRKDRGRTLWSNCREWNAVEFCRICCMARSLRSLRQVATMRHGDMAGRSASLRSCIQGTRGMWTYLTTL